MTTKTREPPERRASTRALLGSGLPSPNLLPWVSRYLYVDRAGPERMQVPASGKSFVFVHFGEGLVTRYRESPLAMGPAVLTGPPPGPFTTRRVGSRFSFIAAELTSIGAFGLFGGGLPDPLHLPLSAVVAPHRVRALVDRVTVSRGRVERVQALDEFLRAQLSHLGAQARCRSVRRAARFVKLTTAYPHRQVAELCFDMGISGALLRRSVREAALTSPKAILQSTRLNLAFKHVLDSPHEPLTALAHRLHFHDQAHFTRAFKAYAGVAPSLVCRDEASLARSLM